MEKEHTDMGSCDAEKPLRRCVFFDRDGIINESPGPGYVEHKDDFHMIAAFPEALRVVRERGFMAIVITNQRGIARGIMTRQAVDQIHDRLLRQLEEQGLHVDDIYVCPHNNNECECRKPLPGMFLQAARKHGIELSASWMIGDNESDVQAGHNAGCATVRVFEGQPHETAADYHIACMKDLPALLRAKLPF
jgi:histidinol-phosphate phosphatase family protein